MSDSLTELHILAFVALLEDAGLTVYRGEADDDPTLPYVVLFTDTGRRSGERPAVSDVIDMLGQVTAVGRSDWQAKWAAGKARDALVDVRPVIAGRACDRIKHPVSRPVERDDDDPAERLFYGVDQYRLRSTAA